MQDSSSSEALFAASRLIAEYALSYDAGDFVRFAAIWTEDAEFTTDPDFGMLPVPMRGRTTIVDAFQALWHGNTGYGIRHYASNVRVISAGQDAIVSLAAMVAVSDPGRRGQQVTHRTGLYRDSFVLRDGVWRFARRSLRYDSDTGGPIATRTRAPLGKSL